MLSQRLSFKVCHLDIKLHHAYAVSITPYCLFTQEQQSQAVKSAEQGRVVQPSLLKALYKAYGLPYLLLGIIKLVNDILGFAGPLLLNVLIRYLETPPHEPDAAALLGSPDPGWRWHWPPQPDSLGFGLLCAALLGVTSLVKVGVLMLDHQHAFLAQRVAVGVNITVQCMCDQGSVPIGHTKSCFKRLALHMCSLPLFGEL